MRLLVLDRSPHGNEADVRSDALLREAAAARGVESAVLTYHAPDDEVLAGIAADDVVLPRADLRSDEDLVAVTEVLWRLGRRGVRCLPTAEGLVATEDKLRTFIRLRHAGVPTPSTVAFCAAGPRLSELAALQGRLQAFPVVVKRPVGWGGRGLWRCDDADGMWDLLHRERDVRPEGAVLVQPYVPHEGVLTVLAAQGRALSARRVATRPGRFSTDAAAATAIPAAPTPDVVLLALGALDACGVTFGAVDFLETEGGKPVCVDVSSLPRLRPDDADHRAFADAIVACALSPAAGPA
jgi:glutathione synthase/RimK-type ligase-like ATP-grasp enzyme